MAQGFYINEAKQINKISGPVSMHILTPGRDFLIRYKNAPIFMLFGDVHNSPDNLCGEAPGTYPIYKMEFLQLLQTTLHAGEVIDFYTEGSDMTGVTSHKITEVEPLMAMYNLVSQCNKLKEAKDAQYETIEKIKWHHTDIRFWDNTSVQAQDVKKTMSQKYTYTVDKFLNLIFKHENYIKKPTRDEFCKVFIAYAKYFKKKVFSLDPNFLATADLIHKEYVTSVYSLINFQLLKISNEDTRKFLIIRFKAYIDYVLDQILTPLLNEVDKSCVARLTEFHKSVVVCFNQMIEEKQGDGAKIIYDHFILRTYLSYMLSIESIQLDMFTLAKSFTRMTETPEGRPIINICYFGDLHIQHMVYFLVYILGYKAPLSKSKNENSTDQPGRCLDLSTVNRVSLEQLLNAIRPPSGGRRATRR
jgi:hypothetical protein